MKGSGPEPGAEEIVVVSPKETDGRGAERRPSRRSRMSARVWARMAEESGEPEAGAGALEEEGETEGAEDGRAKEVGEDWPESEEELGETGGNEGGRDEEAGDGSSSTEPARAAIGPESEGSEPELRSARVAGAGGVGA